MFSDNIQMSDYFQSLTFYLYEKGLLSDELKAILHEHDDTISKKPPVQISVVKPHNKNSSAYRSPQKSGTVE